MTSADAPPYDATPPGEPERRPSAARRALRSTIEWIVILVVALGVALLARTFLLASFYIPSASMDPALAVGDRVLVNKLSYRLHDVNRGDIIVFERPACDQSDPEIKDLIKRAIGLEGQTVEGRDGHVVVDGETIDESYLPRGRTTGDFGPVTVPAGHVWVMGDNRSNSKDSRFLCGGNEFIPLSEVEGRAFVKLWPFADISLL